MIGSRRAQQHTSHDSNQSYNFQQRQYLDPPDHRKDGTRNGLCRLEGLDIRRRSSSKRHVGGEKSEGKKDSRVYQISRNIISIVAVVVAVIIIAVAVFQGS